MTSGLAPPIRVAGQSPAGLAHASTDDAASPQRPPEEPALSPALYRTFAQVADALAPATDPWWIIAGAAAALHGIGDPPPADVDVLLSESNATALLARLGLVPLADGGDGRFRSAVYARWTSPPLAVELMAGLRVRVAGRWHPVLLKTRQPLAIDKTILWVPERTELAAVLRSFGRGKDLARATALERSGGRLT